MAVGFSGMVIGEGYGTLDHIHSNTISVAVGDLVVVSTHVQSNTLAHTDSLVLTDTAGNTYSYRSRLAGSPGQWKMGYVFATAGNASNIITATWGEACSDSLWHEMKVQVFTKDAGKTWSFDDGDTGTNYGTAWSTANIDAAGDDEVCVASGGTPADRTISSQQIGAVAATMDSTSMMISSWHRLLSAPASGINATGTADGADANWYLELLAFKAVSTADPITWTPHVHKRMIFS